MGQLGFRIDAQAVRRAGVDYWHLVDIRQHANFDHFVAAYNDEHPHGRMHLFTGVAKTPYTRIQFQPGDALVFGKESTGLSQEILESYPDAWVGIPTLGAVRSLNLANAVSIGLFEAIRQTGTFENAFTG